ncbi:recombinase family protein [Vibrio rumoiensis]|uniref:recombinase family protein n=1 Tax=Vibrio rumoiensis TaxID=76258 RepID=UPI003AA8A0B1
MQFSHVKPQIYSYRRFSNIRQEKGRSIARQKKLIDEIAEKYNLSINEDFVMTDQGLSAFHGHHKKKGAFGLFLAAVENGIVKPGSVLLVESLDRMSREQPYVAQSTLNSLIDHGIIVVTAVDDRVYSKESMTKDPIGTMLTAIIVMQQAHKESVDKTKKSVDFIHSQIEKHRNGEIADVAGPVPFWINRKPSPSKKIKKGFELNEHEKTIRLLVDMYCNQGMGLRQISRELIEREIKAPKGRNVWGVSTLSSIFKNPALCGRYVFHLEYFRDGETQKEDYILDNYYPSIMTPDEFDALQAIKKRRSGANKGDKSNKGGLVYLLTDYGKKSVCGKCGRGIGSQPQRQKYRVRRRLHCFTHKETEACCKSIVQDHIEDAFLVSVARHIDYNLINTDINPEDMILVSERLQDIEDEMSNVIDMRITVKDESMKLKLKTKYEELEAEKEELSKQKSALKQFKISSGDIRKFIETVSDARDYTNNEARSYIKSILVQCIKKLTVHMEKKKLADYGYKNIYNNQLVNVVDVEFYTDKSLSIFVSAETNKLLFTRISDEFANEAQGSFTEDQLRIWNDKGWAALQENLDSSCEVLSGDPESPENLWLTSDAADVTVQAMFDILEEDD